MDNEFLMSLFPTWHSAAPAIDIHAPDLPSPAGADRSPDDRFFTPYWDKSTDSNGGLMFDSALSSLASSPVSHPNTSATGGFLLRELIGRLGSSDELPYNSGHLFNENSPKLGHSAASPMDPGFTDFSPVGRFSSLGGRSFNGRIGGQFAAMGKMMMSRVSSSPSLKPLGSPVGAPQGIKNSNTNPASQDPAELSNSQEDSSVSNPEKNLTGPETGAKAPRESNWRKRKAAPKEKEAEIEGDTGSKRIKQDGDGGIGNENGSAKAEEEARGGSDEDADRNDEKVQVKNEAKPAEPPKDYIHVRARRGQATDSHSLAERVRREKISERMKILQDLVPGCNKVTGKALMLDEIINYVQSLQRQVEFLSMKLASVNTVIDTDVPTAKDVFQSDSIDPHQMLPLDSSSSALYGQKNPAVNLSQGAIPQYSVDLLNSSQFLPYPAFRGDELHSIVQMGFGQN